MMSTKVENINQKIQFLTKSGIRLHILNILSKNPQNIKELVNTTQITYSTLSSNLHKLQQEKYIQKIKENNSYYQTELIEYELYEEKELEEYLEKGIQDEILLPVKKGRQVIYDMVKSGICIIYKFRSKEEEEVMQKLYDLKTGEGQKS